jgi:serine protease inhibitor
LLKSAAARVPVARSAWPDQQRQLTLAALALGAGIVAGSGGRNVVTSPAGLLCALAMLRAGAGSTTAAELDGVLGLPLEGRDEAMNALLSQLEEFAGAPGSVDEDEPPSRPLLHLAQGLFVEETEPTGEAYLETLARHYGSGVRPVSFAAAERTKRAMDAWVVEHTGGRITEAPTEYSADNTFSMLSTVYFAGAWAAPFDPLNTQPEPFALVDGAVVPVPTMMRRLTLAYAQGPFGQAVDLPYGKGFVLRLLLPPDGKAAPEEEPDAAAWRRIGDGLAGSRARRRIDLALPKWDHTATLDLCEVLPALGLVETFGSRPDLEAIQRRLKITAAVQAANITVGEKGTVAAAVTQLDFMVTGLPFPEEVLELRFDRPFLYQVVHARTGMPLFMGRVADPRPESESTGGSAEGLLTTSP